MWLGYRILEAEFPILSTQYDIDNNTCRPTIIIHNRGSMSQRIENDKMKPYLTKITDKLIN